jgi:uncharacterized cupredoxin-like copper-binding protein
MRAAVAPAAAVAALLAMAGCGEKHETTTGPASGGGGSPSGAPISIAETEYKLSPSSANVDRGGTVSIKVKNEGTTTHALEVEGPSGEVKTPTIAPGRSATLQANLSKAGTYEMYCPIDGHKGKGMKGEISVGGGGGGSGGAGP